MILYQIYSYLIAHKLFALGLTKDQVLEWYCICYTCQAYLVCYHDPFLVEVFASVQFDLRLLPCLEPAIDDDSRQLLLGTGRRFGPPGLAQLPGSLVG